MEHQACISDCMKHKVFSCPPDLTVRLAADLMANNNIGTLPVIDQETRLIGVTTMDDIIQIFLPDFVSLLSNISFVKVYGNMGTLSPTDLERAEKLFVGDIMGEPISVENDCELIRALSFMHKYKIQDLPVVENGYLVGIASRVDIGRAFLSSWLNPKIE